MCAEILKTAAGVNINRQIEFQSTVLHKKQCDGY